MCLQEILCWHLENIIRVWILNSRASDTEFWGFNRSEVDINRKCFKDTNYAFHFRLNPTVAYYNLMFFLKICKLAWMF